MNEAAMLLLAPPQSQQAANPPSGDRMWPKPPTTPGADDSREYRWNAFVMGAVAAWVVPLLGWIALSASLGNTFVWWGIVVAGAVATDGYFALSLWPRIEAGKHGWRDVAGLLTLVRFVSARACLLVILGLVAAIPELSSNPATVSSLSGVAPTIIARTAAASGVIMIPLLVPTACDAHARHGARAPSYHNIPVFT